MIGFPRFECPECGRMVASVYKDAIHVSLRVNGRRFHYAYLRQHHRPDGTLCPQTTTGPLATVLPITPTGNVDELVARR